MVAKIPLKKYEFVNWDDEIPNGKAKNVPNHHAGQDDDLRQLLVENMFSKNVYPLVMTNMAIKHGPFIVGLQVYPSKMLPSGNLTWLFNTSMYSDCSH